MYVFNSLLSFRKSVDQQIFVLCHSAPMALFNCTPFLLIVVTILAAFFIWSRRTYFYWQRRRIKFVQPKHLVGNLWEVIRLRNSFGMQLSDFYFDERFRSEPLVGIYLFHQPALLIRNLTLVQRILETDFVNFSNRFACCDPFHDKLGALNLYFAKNSKWRDIRTKLSPMFTGGKLKQMFSLMEQIGCELELHLLQLSDEQLKEVRIKKICDLYSIDMISSIVFGFCSHNLRNKQTEIDVRRRQMRKSFSRRLVDIVVIFFLPKWVRLLCPKLFTTSHAAFLRRTVTHAIDERDKSGKFRNDLIEMLLTCKKEAELIKNKRHFTHLQDYLTAQVALFEFAGVRTCAGTMSFALYELAKHPAVQSKLRTEILGIFAKGALNYEGVMGMAYLGMVIEETLRKYPAVPFLERECTPINKQKVYSFEPQVECAALRGQAIYISNLALHYDPQNWPFPNVFKPERFSADQKKFHKPMSYLPFGAGPHNCIGISMAMLQIKLGLMYFLRNHRVEICDKTVDSISFDKKYALLTPERQIYLKIVKSKQ